MADRLTPVPNAMNRQHGIEWCAGQGTCTIHKRVNEEPCPKCRGEYDEVYQWTTKFADDTRFCICDADCA